MQAWKSSMKQATAQSCWRLQLAMTPAARSRAIALLGA